jgi:hypothetical protein
MVLKKNAKRIAAIIIVIALVVVLVFTMLPAQLYMS